MSSTRTQPAIFQRRRLNSGVPTPTTSTPAAIDIGAGSLVTPWTRTGSPLARACCWSRLRGAMEPLARNVKLNRAGVAPEHSLADGPATIVDVTLSHGRTVAWGNISVLLGYSDVDSAGPVAVEDGVRGYLTWSHGLR